MVLTGVICVALLLQQESVGIVVQKLLKSLYLSMDCYPKVDLWIEKKDDHSAIYYVEFGRGGKGNEFTLFKRHFIRSKEEIEKIKKECPECFTSNLMLECNEGHPYNIFTANYGPEGCVPDRKWVCWMVDCLNDKLIEEEKEQKRKEYYASLPEDPNLIHRP